MPNQVPVRGSVFILEGDDPRSARVGHRDGWFPLTVGQSSLARRTAFESYGTTDPSSPWRMDSSKPSAAAFGESAHLPLGFSEGVAAEPQAARPTRTAPTEATAAANRFM